MADRNRTKSPLKVTVVAPKPTVKDYQNGVVTRLSTPHSRPTLHFPPEILSCCFHFLPLCDLIKVSHVCRVWYETTISSPGLCAAHPLDLSQLIDKTLARSYKRGKGQLLPIHHEILARPLTSLYDVRAAAPNIARGGALKGELDIGTPESSAPVAMSMLVPASAHMSWPPVAQGHSSLSHFTPVGRPKWIMQKNEDVVMFDVFSAVAPYIGILTVDTTGTPQLEHFAATIFNRVCLPRLHTLNLLVQSLWILREDVDGGSLRRITADGPILTPRTCSFIKSLRSFTGVIYGKNQLRRLLLLCPQLSCLAIHLTRSTSHDNGLDLDMGQQEKDEGNDIAPVKHQHLRWVRVDLGMHQETQPLDLMNALGPLAIGSVSNVEDMVLSGPAWSATNLAFLLSAVDNATSLEIKFEPREIDCDRLASWELSLAASSQEIPRALKARLKEHRERPRRRQSQAFRGNFKFMTHQSPIQVQLVHSRGRLLRFEIASDPGRPSLSEVISRLSGTYDHVQSLTISHNFLIRFLVRSRALVHLAALNVTISHGTLLQDDDDNWGREPLILAVEKRHRATLAGRLPALTSVSLVGVDVPRIGQPRLFISVAEIVMLVREFFHCRDGELELLELRNIDVDQPLVSAAVAYELLGLATRVSLHDEVAFGTQFRDVASED
ncbi:hypothetical protein BKA62DRAFT_283763 [Auriculariales sp. MPI-PUGE-AT-0066]|nr:hypothetical protein BKA62DRAFT_283763 [Auriculariales sp. MPI-PUGE-AT-0066]